MLPAGILLIIRRYYSVVHCSSSGGTIQWFTAHYLEVLFCGSLLIINRKFSVFYCST
jgi:hypothetical protein